MEPRTASLLNVLKEVFGNRIVYDDGNATMGTLDAELIERSIHAVDASFIPSRPDSAVMPCVHGCGYCRDNDVPSSRTASSSH